MPNYTILYLYIALHIFTIFQYEQARGFMAECNPRAKPLMLFSGVGMAVEYLYPILFIIFLGKWYWGIGMYVMGMVAGAISFNMVRAYIGIEGTVYFSLFGFIGIPASIAGIAYYSL